MSLHPLAGALLAAGGQVGIDLTLTVATVVLFAVFALVLAKFAWGPLLHMIEEREKGIKDAVDGAERSAAEAKELLEKHKDMLREAGREREEIIKRALKEADVLKTDLHAKARSESEAMIGRAKEQVEREKQLAILELRQQVADLAIEAASRIVKSSLTPEAQKQLVDDFIKDLPRAASH
jgi:F-type H+-transporting ATPase subunit b